MPRPWSLLPVVVLLPVLAIGQVTEAGEFAVRTGTPFTNLDCEHKYYLPHGDNVIALKVDGDKWHIQRFSAGTLGELSVTDYEDLPDHPIMEWVGTFGEKLIVLYSSEERKPRQQRLFLREIDPGTGTFKGPGALVLSVAGRVRGTIIPLKTGGIRLQQRFFVALSPDGQKMMVHYEHDDTNEFHEPKGTELGAAVFKADMALEWQGDLAFPADAGRVRSEVHAVDNQGRAYVVGYHMLDPGNPDLPPKREEVLGRFAVGDVRWSVFPAVPGASSSKELMPYGRADGTIGLTCFCKTDDAVFKNALCLYTISEEGMAQLRTTPLPADAIDLRFSLEGEKARKYFRFDPAADLLLCRLEPLKGGGLLVMGERHYRTSEIHQTSNGSGGLSDVSVVIEHYEDALVLALGGDGSLAWASRSPKAVGPAFTYVNEGGRYWYFYGTDPEAVNMPVTISYNDWRKMNDAHLYAFSIDPAHGDAQEHSIAPMPNIRDVQYNEVDWERVVNMGDGRLVIEVGAGGKQSALMEVKRR